MACELVLVPLVTSEETIVSFSIMAALPFPAEASWSVSETGNFSSIQGAVVIGNSSELALAIKFARCGVSGADSISTPPTVET